MSQWKSKFISSQRHVINAKKTSILLQFMTILQCVPESFASEKIKIAQNNNVMINGHHSYTMGKIILQILVRLVMHL